jgi:transcriptional regulator with XRE-family HTH domain
MSTKNKLSYSVADQRHWQKRLKELTFGRSIRAYRLSEEWTLADAAEKIGIGVQQLSDYEHGRKLPSIEQAHRIAIALDMMPAGAVLQVINEQLIRAELTIKVKLAS